MEEPATLDAVLAVDLGATFTKVAYRPRPSGDDVWWSERLDLDDGWEGRGLVPSAFARRRSDGAPAFGYEAFRSTGDEWETFADWKRKLFVDGDDDALARLRPMLEEFLAWIGRSAREAGRSWSRVVVTAPLLDGERARRGRDVLREAACAAFRDADAVTLTDEPSAAFRGAVMGHVNARAEGRMLIKDRGGLWEAARDAATGRRRASAFRAVVCDLGSLTLDLCLLEFDLARDEVADRLVPRVGRATSVLLGTDLHLDPALHQMVSLAGPGAPPPRPSEVWTRIRRRLLRDLAVDVRRSHNHEAARRAMLRPGERESAFAGTLFSSGADPFPAPIGHGGAEHGTRTQWEAAEPLVAAYASALADAIRSIDPDPEYVLLTGGGYRSGRLCREVGRALGEAEAVKVHDTDYLERVFGDERRGLELARFGTVYGAANILARAYD